LIHCTEPKKIFKKNGKKGLKSKNGKAQSICKQSGEYVESVMEKKRKAMLERICRKETF